MAKKCLILAGGSFEPIPAPSPEDFVIACDRGYEYACRCGIRPDLIIGDFDSYGGPLPEDIPIERLPVRKDDTDTVHALRRALELGCEDIEILWGLGGRLDHSLANIQTAVFGAVHGARVTVKDSRTELRVMTPGVLYLPRREGWSLSLFSLGDQCTVLCLRGTKYPLEDAVLTNTFPLGVSNDWTAAQAEIKLGSGLLLIVMAKCQ